MKLRHSRFKLVIPVLLIAAIGGSHSVQARQTGVVADRPASTNLAADAGSAIGFDLGAFCGTDLRSDAAIAALRSFADAARNGDLPRIAKKSAAPPQVGDRASFNVSEESWTPLEFELKQATAAYYLWIEVGQLTTGNVTDAELQSLEERMMVSTPSESYRPEAGILQNNRDLFGEMPDYDGDGMLDILVYDIEPGDNDGSYVLGYVSSVDILPGAGEGVGNQRDVLYLDANQGTRSIDILAGIAAHELGHLIHYTYGGDDTFIMEGLAEYSMIANGFLWRSPTYLLETPELQVPLFGWRQDVKDYERGSLFFSYLAQRVGPEVVGGMMRGGPNGGPEQGSYGVDTRLREVGITLKAMILDFHTANVLNDRTVDENYGYLLPNQQLYRAVKPLPIDGFSRRSTVVEEVRFEGGAVRYTSWNDVADFSLQFDALGTLPHLIRPNLAGRVVTTKVDGTRTVSDPAAGNEGSSYAGDRKNLLFILAGVNAASTNSTPATYEASWNHVQTTVDADPGAELPARVELGQNWPNPFNPSTTIPFSVPNGGAVRIELFDLLGRSLGVVHEATVPAGTHEVRLDLSSRPSGIYIYTLDTAGVRVSRTLTLLR